MSLSLVMNAFTAALTFATISAGVLRQGTLIMRPFGTIAASVASLQ